MDDAGNDIRKAARTRAYSMPIEDIKPLDPEMFREDTFWPYFERLRAEDPVHYAVDDEVGPYWSIMKFNDIMAVDTNHQVFSSEPAITAFDPEDDFRLPMFIAMDPPKHDAQRKTVSPIVSPHNLLNLEPVIRERPPASRRHRHRRGIQLGGQGFHRTDDHDAGDAVRFPLGGSAQADPLVGYRHRPGDARRPDRDRGAAPRRAVRVRRLLPQSVERARQRAAEERLDLDARHGESTRNMDRMEYLGNLILLIVGGNDTTRNTITGSILALNQNPDQYQKLRDNPALIPSMVSETIRWQTPLAYMRRTAKEDFTLRGKTIKAGEKVLMWYVSGNRDDEVIENPNRYDIERERPRHHMVVRLRHPSLCRQSAG